MLRRKSATRDESARGAISAITSVSAWRSSSADWKRLSRSGASAFSATWSSAGVIQGARVEGAHQLGVANQRQRRRRIQPRQLQELLPGQQLPQHDAQACRRRCARRPSRRAPARAPGTAARPNTTPGAVCSCLSTLRARPKSVSFTSPT